MRLYVVIEDTEVLFLQSGDGPVQRVVHAHRHEHKVGIDSQSGRARRLFLFFGHRLPARLDQDLPQDHLCGHETILRVAVFPFGSRLRLRKTQSSLCRKETKPGIIAKRRDGVSDPDAPTWIEVKNRQYSQAVGRHERFERRVDRTRRPPRAAA